jgi:hypothetical protein
MQPATSQHPLGGLFVLGDFFHELPSVGGRPAFFSPAWKAASTIYNELQSDMTNLAGTTHDHCVRLIGRAPADSFVSSFVHDHELLNNISFLTNLHFDGNGHSKNDVVQQVIHPLNANSLISGREPLLGCAPAGSKCQVVCTSPSIVHAMKDYAKSKEPLHRVLVQFAVTPTESCHDSTKYSQTTSRPPAHDTASHSILQLQSLQNVTPSHSSSLGAEK